MLLSTLALAFASQATDCNNAGYTNVSLPGIQPSSQVLEPCPGGSFTVTVKLATGGALELVGADVQGAFTVTIQLPTSCVKSYIEHSGDIHECTASGTLEGWDCNPRGAQVQVKYWKADPACPNPVTQIGDFLGSLANFNPDLASIPLHFPCNPPEDATDELDDSAKIRNTARLTKCKGKKDAGVFEVTGGTSTSFVGDGPSLFARIQGSPEDVDFRQLEDQGAPLAGSITVTGAHPLLQAIHGSGAAGPNVGSLLRSIANRDSGVGSIQGVQATIQLTEIRYNIADGIPAESTRSWSASVEGNRGGESQVVASEVVAGVDGDIVFTEQVVTRAGDEYVLDLQAQTGAVHLRANGGAAHASVSSLRHLIDLRSWLTDPYSLPRGPAMEATTTYIDSDHTEVSLAPRHSADESMPGYALFLALMDQRFTYVIDHSGEVPQVVSLTAWRGGRVVETREFSRYYQLEGGPWRPGSVTIEEFGSDGAPVRIHSLMIRGGKAGAERSEEHTSELQSLE